MSFVGGELLVELELLLRLADEARRLCAARELACGLSVTTNGTLLTLERAQALAARDVHIGLSIDGVPEAQTSRGRPWAAGAGRARARRGGGGERAEAHDDQGRRPSHLRRARARAWRTSSSAACGACT